MFVISRRLPDTNISRKRAFGKADFKISNPGPVGSAITPATTARFVAINGLYLPAYALVQQRRAELSVATVNKNAAMQDLRLLDKHFVGVFNYGVERGKYPAGHRSYYGISADNSNLPDLGTEQQVTDLAQVIVSGDLLRVAAGGAAMANPSAAEVQVAIDVLTPLYVIEDHAKEALDLAQEALDALNVEADKVIKKIWDEVETFFNEEAAPSMRMNARLWGVVYVSKGPPALLNGKVKTAAGVVWAGANVLINETGSTATTNSEGRFTLTTSVVGTVTITVTTPDSSLSVTVEVDIPEHDGEVTITVPDIILG